MNKFYKRTTKFIVLAILTLTLILSWTPKSVGQIPLFTTPTNNQPTQSPPWDLNKAYTCGKFWCSNVYIYDEPSKIETSLLTPELTLTVLRDRDQSSLEAAEEVEQRAKLVQRVFERIFERITRTLRTSKVSDIPDWQFWLPTTVKPLHPQTPKIEVGIQNEQTVIYVPNQPELGLAAQAIVTVTQIDAKANGKTIEQLAKAWRSSIRKSFSNALWGHELNLHYPLWRWGISGAIMGVTIALIWLIELIRSLLRKWNNRLKQKLNKITDSLAVDPEATASQQREKNITDAMDDSESLENQISQPDDNSLKSIEKTAPSVLRQTKLFNFIKDFFKNKWVLPTYHLPKQMLFLRHQTLIQQKRNFCQLLLRLTLISEILTPSLSLVLIVLIFRQTRFLSVYLLKETLILLIFWSCLIFADKLGDFLIDYLLNRWASEAQIADPSSNRYTLRANTYSKTFKRGTTFFAIVFGLYMSIWLIGINPSVLAGAGVVAVAVAFLSRSLLEDIINGILILYTDRYAIGDVIDLGNGMSGTVEDINLFITSLRNLDGQLIAVPNRRIDCVINNTKNWSRVNFTIRIAWDEDIDKAIAVMTQVATTMQNEPEWGEKFLEAAEILGVDEVSHEGIVVHLIIKTQPSEQWSVGREFRRRVKQALDEAGVSVGIPHHQISIIHSQKDSDQLLSKLISKQE